MIIPVGVDYAASRYPVVTFTLIGVNAFVFLLEIAAAFSGNATAVFSSFGLTPSEPVLWTWVTSLFIHAGVLHLVGNMVYLFLFGSCIEDILGRGRFLAFYMVGGVLANIIQVLLTAEASAHLPIVGASGAISACIGGFVVVLPRSHINFRYFFWLLWFYTGEFWLRSWIVITFWFLSDLLGLVLELSEGSGTGGVAFAAHVGGTIAGASTLLALRRRLGKADGSPARPQTEAPALVRVTAQAQESDDQSMLYLYVNGQEVGPYPRSKVKDMVRIGAIPGDALFWREGLEEWRCLSEL